MINRLQADEPVTVVVFGRFAEGYEDYFEAYSRAVAQLLEHYGAKVIRRQQLAETIFGEPGHDLVMLVDMASVKLARRVFSGEHYLSIVPLRDKVFSSFCMQLARHSGISSR